MIRGHNCPICDKERFYKSGQGVKKGQNKPCFSCSNSLKAGGVGNVRNSKCFDCGENPREYNSLCLPCHNNRSKLYYKKKGRWSKYGLNGPIEIIHCEICNSVDDLVIDHCHNKKRVRGILCRTCNLGIGSLKDNKEIIRKALMYAERTFTE